MTKERYDELVEVYGAPAKAEELFEAGIDGAVEKLQAEGYDFTREEIFEFYQALDKENEAAAENKEGELGEEALENVAGGLLGAALVAIGISYMAYTGKHGYLSNPGVYPPWSSKKNKK